MSYESESIVLQQTRKEVEATELTPWHVSNKTFLTEINKGSNTSLPNSTK